MKRVFSIVLILSAFAASDVVFATELRLGAGGLARDSERHVYQVSLSVPGADRWQLNATRWDTDDALSLTVRQQWKYFEIGGGVGYAQSTEPNVDNDRATVHVRLGPSFGPFFVSYEYVRDEHGNRAADFFLGGVQIRF
jgi:hypothetical protein